MKKKIVIGIAAVLALFAVILFVYGNTLNAPYEAAEDEIVLRIQLNVKEDLGLLLIDYKTNDSAGTGGISNADKSLLKHDELIIHTLNRQDIPAPSGVDDLSVKFTVVTDYVDPNYENIYPKELMKAMNEISFSAEFGRSYSITISGGRDDGYKAVLTDDDI